MILYSLHEYDEQDCGWTVTGSVACLTPLSKTDPEDALHYFANLILLSNYDQIYAVPCSYRSPQPLCLVEVNVAFSSRLHHFRRELAQCDCQKSWFHFCPITGASICNMLSKGRRLG
jgi:hypothetical protein